QEALFATVCYLAADENLSLISIWSPSFLRSLLEIMVEKADWIRDVLTTGHWNLKIPAPRNMTAAKKLVRLRDRRDTEVWKGLWPKLALISCWDTAMSRSVADEVRTIFPHVPLQGKGVWTTEAVLTIPFQ